MRRVATILAILAIAIGILVSAHLYLATRLVLDPGLDGSARSILLWVIAMLGIGMVLQPVAERFYRPPALRCLSLIPLLWMGVLLLTVVMLLVFGGGAINDFALALFIGIVVGTYSSIFVATPVMLLWHREKKPQEA